MDLKDLPICIFSLIAFSLNGWNRSRPGCGRVGFWLYLGIRRGHLQGHQASTRLEMVTLYWHLVNVRAHLSEGVPRDKGMSHGDNH
ncbi:hypothetical protein ACYZUA_15335 [Pseudomonas sp. LS2P72]